MVYHCGHPGHRLCGMHLRIVPLLGKRLGCLLPIITSYWSRILLGYFTVWQFWAPIQKAKQVHYTRLEALTCGARERALVAGYKASTGSPFL